MSWLRHLYFNLLYFRQPPWDTQVSPPELLEFIEDNPPGRALDLGCGTGTNVITLAQHGWQVSGVDYVKRAVRQARLKAHRAGVSAEFFANDVTKLDYIHGVFDLVLDIGCFHSLNTAEKQAFLDNLTRLTDPGSYYLLYGFIRSQSDSGPGMDETDLKAFQKFFTPLARVDGTDRGERPSIWLTYERRTSENMQLATDD